MKRLKNILLAMNQDTSTYIEMYNGEVVVIDPKTRSSYIDFSSVYYSTTVGFDITVTHKSAQDKPTVTVIIPYDKILPDVKGDKYLKRLKYYLLQMENDTASYKEIYEGKSEVIFPSTAWDGHAIEPEIQYDNRYWHDSFSVDIDNTHKLAQDKPTLTWHIPTDELGIETYTDAAADFCLRELNKYINELNESLYNRSRPDNENGKYYLCRPGGEVIKRNTAYFALCPQKDYENGSGSTVYILNDGIERPQKMCLCIRMQVQLPKRKIRKTIQMLCRDLPDAFDRFIREFDLIKLSKVLELAEKQIAIRQWLKSSEYCAFIANGSILPRSKGTQLPMLNAIPFKSAPDDEIIICGVRGMGIKKGVTVITGGGYSGKSTILDGISSGIYDHCLGDGRELCITDNTAITISAEDGRSIKNVNISPFIKWLPNGDTHNFSTDHASGSTSQAANIMESIDGGAKLLLIDEDKSATNFMIRDRMMKELINKEPITPFTDRACELWRELGISTILVIGGSGEYLSVADRIYMMEDYCIHDVTESAKKLCKKYTISDIDVITAEWKQHRQLTSKGFTSYPDGLGSERLQVSDMGFIIIGDEKIDIRGLHDIISAQQKDALGFMLRYLAVSNKESFIDIKKNIDELYKKIRIEGLDCVYSAFFTTCERFLELPRKQELLAVINRMRGIEWIIK